MSRAGWRSNQIRSRRRRPDRDRLVGKSGLFEKQRHLGRIWSAAKIEFQHHDRYLEQSRYSTIGADIDGRQPDFRRALAATAHSGRSLPAARFFSRGELEKMTTTTMEVSETLERVDNIVNMLDEICDDMDRFSSAEEAWLSNITETLRTWRYVMQETYESPEGNKDNSFRSWILFFFLRARH
jgi:hypothetical protein